VYFLSSFDLVVPVTLTNPISTAGNDLDTGTRPRCPEDQGFQKLEHEWDRQTEKHTHTHRQTQPNALPAAFMGGKNVQ